MWRSRKGLTVEIGNTDAEGRLVLADALAEADAERPDLLIDMATLTGAARTALGPDLPAVFSNDAVPWRTLRTWRAIVSAIRCGPCRSGPGYDDELASRIADLNNISASPFAGAIIAALFLKRFVTATPAWLHVDLYAWNPQGASRPADRRGSAGRARALCADTSEIRIILS